MRMLAPATIALVLAGCATDTLPEPPPSPARACVADGVQRFVGQQATPALVDQVRLASGSATARRSTPEMRVTMDFRPDRVNVWVGLKGEVERVTCG